MSCGHLSDESEEPGELTSSCVRTSCRRYKEEKDEEADESDENDVSKYDLSDFTLVDETKGRFRTVR